MTIKSFKVETLKDNLLEKSEKVRQIESSEELVEELADILEVIQTLSSTAGITMEEIEKKRVEKRQLQGRFEEKIVSSQSNAKETNPTQYPQINHKIHQSNCLFCHMSRGERKIDFFAKFQHCYVIKDQFPVSPGHLLIIPYQHTDNWFTATEEVRLDILKALSVVKDMLDLDYSPQGYNIGANCGQIAGQSVMHLHVHLIPRYQGDMEDPKGGVRGVIPSKQKY